MHKLFFLSLILPFALNAQANVSNADLSKKLDLILNKVGRLEQRLSRLESDNAEVKKEVKQVTKSVEEAKTATESLTIPQDPEEKKSFLNKLRIDLKSEEVKAKGPWARKETWATMKTNLTEHKTRKLLGTPNDIKISLNPRIDRVFIYKGDINANGKEEIAKVNFFNNRVVSYESPFRN